jgi:ABC-type phosphate transport system permease subunit
MRKFSDGFLTGFAWLSGLGAVLVVALLLGFLIWRGIKTITVALFFGQTPWFEAITGQMPVFDGILPALVGTIFLVLLASIIAVPVGIASGIILTIGRASEDTAVILLTGVVAHAGIPRNLWDKFEALPFHIYYLAAEYRNPSELEQGFGTALVLLLVTGLLFLAAYFLRRHTEKRWHIR